MAESESRNAPVIAEGLFSFDIGGGERIGINTAIAFKQRGYRVICFGMYGDDGPLRPELAAAGIECVRLSYLQRWRPTRRLLYPLAAARLFRRERVAALHVHYGAALMIIRWGARLAGVSRVVMTEHALHQYIERAEYRRSTQRACKHATAITGVHPGILDYFRDEMGVPAQRLHFVANGIAVPSERVSRNDDLRTAHRVQSNEFLLVFVGRLHTAKDLPTLLDALAMVPRVRLWIVGDGAERQALELRIDKLGLGPRVTMWGEQIDVNRFLRAADACVMTSVTEGMPMALLEAMALRVPCIATSVGGIPKLLADGAGVVIPPSNPAAAADAIRRLESNSAERDQIAQRGFERARDHYSLERSVDQYLYLLGLPPRWLPGSGER
jgi:glycosyltransferase involved in cell wall biosynthesis